MIEFDTPSVSYAVKDHLLIAIYKKGTPINLPIAKEMVQERLSLTGQQEMVTLIFNQRVVSIDKAARAFLCSSAGNQGLLAAAIIQDSPFAAVSGNFFLSVHKPDILGYLPELSRL